MVETRHERHLKETKFQIGRCERVAILCIVHGQAYVCRWMRALT